MTRKVRCSSTNWKNNLRIEKIGKFEHMVKTCPYPITHLLTYSTHSLSHSLTHSVTRNQSILCLLQIDIVSMSFGGQRFDKEISEHLITLAKDTVSFYMFMHIYVHVYIYIYIYIYIYTYIYKPNALSVGYEGPSKLNALTTVLLLSLLWVL